MSDDMNEQLLLISGESASGKSASLQGLRNQDRWLYLNCESGKRLPFRNNFEAHKITDPYQVHEAIEFISTPAEDEGGADDYDGAIIDTSTFLMNMFETQYVKQSANTQKAWGDYADFWQRMLLELVPQSSKSFIFLAHTRSDLNEETGRTETAVPIKGALKGNGIESFFSTVVSAKKMDLKHLKDMDPELLHVTEDDEVLGYKHVFQTKLTKKTVGERIRAPMGLWNNNQLFVDNDAQLVLDHLADYYGLEKSDAA